MKKIITPHVIISGRRAAMFQMFQRVMAQISAVCRHAMDLLEELSSVPTSLSPPLIPFCTWLCGQSWNLTKRTAVQFTGQGEKIPPLINVCAEAEITFIQRSVRSVDFCDILLRLFFFLRAARCPL